MSWFCLTADSLDEELKYVITYLLTYLLTVVTVLWSQSSVLTTRPPSHTVWRAVKYINAGVVDATLVKLYLFTKQLLVLIPVQAGKLTVCLASPWPCVTDSGSRS